MTRRKRVPLQLKGSDEQYFRTREIQMPPADDAPMSAPEGQGAGADAGPPEPAPPHPDGSEAEIVSRIVPLGPALTERIQALAGQAGVPVDDLLYAARKKAVARFRKRIAGKTKPAIPQVARGGETIRISLKLSAGEMARLKGWFDPFDIGLATKVVAPLLAEALQGEVTKICDSVS